MAQRPGFDMNKMSTATKILLGASLVYFIDSFLPWQRVCFKFLNVGACGSVNLWHGIGFITGLLVLLLLVEEALRAFGVGMGSMPASTVNMVSAGLAAGVVLFTLLKVVVDHQFISFGAYIGIVLGLAIAYGGWMRWQEAKVAGPAGPMAPPAAPPPPPPPGGGFSG